jgi:hypothetical protein
MALTAEVQLLNSIPDVVLAGNRIPLKFQASTNLISNEGSKAEILITWTGIPDPDLYFDLLLFGQTVRFTCKVTPDNSGAQFHDGTGLATLADWVAVLAEDLLRNYLITRYYDITVDAESIDIIAKESGAAFSQEFTPGPDIEATADDSQKTGEDQSLQPFYGIVVLLYCNNTFVSELILNVDEEGNAETDIAELLKPYLSQELQWPESDVSFIFDCPAALASWNFYYGERWGSNAYQALALSDTYYAIDGGVSRMQLLNYFLSETDFWTKLQASKYFLSWAPLTRIIAPDEPVKLYFMNHSAATSLKLMAKLYTASSDSTVTIETVSDVADKTIWELVLSPAKVEYAGISDQTLVKIEVWIQDQSDAVISEIRTFILDYTHYEHTRYFIFKNSLGAFECLRSTGLMAKSESVTRETAQVSGRTDWDSFGAYYAISDREELSISNLEQQKFIVALGWMNRYADSEEYRNWLRDFALSKEVYQVIGNTIKPIRLTGNNFDHGKDRDTFTGFVFEFVNAFSDENFTKEITRNLVDETYANDFERAQ